jgi:hypothetical protein
VISFISIVAQAKKALLDKRMVGDLLARSLLTSSPLALVETIGPLWKAESMKF